jgi:hypothetical protein
MKSLISAFFGLFLLTHTLGCQVQTTRDAGNENKVEGPTLVDPKYSISKDRSEFDKLRESIPAEVRQSNDEKALMAEWFSEVKLEPEKIRDKFDTIVRKKRELFNKDLTKQREAFNKEEKKKREEFLKDLEEERKDFLKRKVDKDKRAEFFNEQDEKRRNYFADQKDKREDFESNVREKRKDFEDYIKEKNNDFSSELKAYRIKWTEKKTQQQTN